jgi:hypothetical protein
MKEGGESDRVTITADRVNIGITGSNTGLVTVTVTTGPAPPTTDAYPGQPENLVGFAAAPGYSGDELGSGLEPCAWPPTLANGGVTDGPDWGQGTADNPTIVKGKDFDSGVSGPSFTLSLDGTANTPMIEWAVIEGCRWQSHQPWGASTAVTCCATSGQTAHVRNVKLRYCSIVPRATWQPPSPANSAWPTQAWTKPPSAAWPSASAGTGFKEYTSHEQKKYSIPRNDSYLFCIAAAAEEGTFLIIDHCDFWGAGDIVNAVAYQKGDVQLLDTYLHDPRWAFDEVWDATKLYPNGWGVWGSDGNGYVAHFWPPDLNSDNPGYVPVGVDPTTDDGTWWARNTDDHTNGIIASAPNAPFFNFLLDHCTVAGIGNTNAVAFQWNNIHNYSGIKVRRCYLSGFNQTLAVGSSPLSDNPSHPQGVYDTGMEVTDNVWATDIAPMGGPVQRGDFYPTQFDRSKNPSNLWARNKVKLYPGATWWQWGATPADDGKYLWPDGTFHDTDWDSRAPLALTET